MKSGVALLLTFLGLLGVPTGALAKDVFERASRDEVVRMPDENPAMAAAFAKARATLDEFLKLLDAPPKDTHGYAIKLLVRDGHEGEYFWVINLKREGERFSGILNNTPRLVKNVNEGQVMRFGRNDIVDWLYVDAAQRRMMGNFTLCALLTLEKPATAARFKRQTGLVCD